MRNLSKKNKSGVSFMEYAVILGVASTVLLGMSTYIKRGIQGRVKEMTDNFISREQVIDINPELTVKVSSHTDSTSQSNIENEGFIGGGTKIALLDSRDIVSESQVLERRSTLLAGGVSADAANKITPASAPTNETLENSQRLKYAIDLKNATDLKYLEKLKSNLDKEAKSLRGQAERLRENGNRMIYDATYTRCPRKNRHGRKKCKAALKEMYNQGLELLRQAENMVEGYYRGAERKAIIERIANGEYDENTLDIGAVGREMLSNLAQRRIDDLERTQGGKNG
ncbi:MAG: hypothetical protein A3G38_02030 [Omnitrophica WOR_2 bacterium RIFCSPLOWO2_12_FULL_51_8]|nr:MAG: hypothetical protein A3G38_02030 [Omnitrophica WOR_2 bacterium RIFCSPLOWO2_12_FULL_51_8]